jgi:hypothetical protein
MRFYTKHAAASCYQDRLGTNIGKSSTQKREMMCFSYSCSRTPIRSVGWETQARTSEQSATVLTRHSSSPTGAKQKRLVFNLLGGRFDLFSNENDLFCQDRLGTNIVKR